MFRFSFLNRMKTEQCSRDNITVDNASEFVEMGDASPLYRWVDPMKYVRYILTVFVPRYTI